MLKIPLLALAIPACAAGGADTLPDGATGVQRIQQGAQTMTVPWVAAGGQKWIDDDFAIGPALADPDGVALYAQSIDRVGKWPHGHVPYCIHRTGDIGIPVIDAARIEDSLANLNQIAPLHFEEFFTCDADDDMPGGGDYLDYRRREPDDTTNSSVTVPGIDHAGTTIQFPAGGSDGHITDPLVTHETGHALGYMHEQKRPDRDDYVVYTKACVVSPEKLKAFDLVSYDDIDHLLTPYDVTSVMEYGSFTFSRDTTTCPTLTWAAPDPATAPWLGTFETPTGEHIRGTEIRGHTPWSEEDINATYQLYEPVLGSPEIGDRLGAQMVAADFDDDGYDDLAVGAIGEQVGSGHGGAVFLYKGTKNGLVAWKVLSEADFGGATSHAGDQFGGALAAGDLNGDGIPDLVVGAPFYGSNQSGAVFAYRSAKRGGPAAVGGPVTQASTGAGANEPDDMFGAALAIGKFAGGKTAYLAVGAPFEVVGGASRGMVTVLQALGTGFAFPANLHPADVGIAIDDGQFGSALAAGDLDGDGKTDLVVGAPGDVYSTGHVATFFGTAPATDHSVPMVPGASLAPVETPANGDRLGTSVATAPYFGAQVILAGAPGHAGPGRAYTFSRTSGRTYTGVTAIAESQIAGQYGHTGDGFGTRVGIVATAGNSVVMVVAAPGKPIASVAGAGAVFVFDATGRALAPSSPTPSDGFGTAFAIGNFDHGAHGLDTDTSPDLAIGVPGRTVDSKDNAGKIDVYRGPSYALWRQITEETPEQN